MKLFEIDENYQVRINKEWILLIPELAELFRRDKGTVRKDPDGKSIRVKQQVHRELAFIYFYVSFASPLRDWPDHERLLESLKYANLTEKDIDKDVQAACEMYRKLQLSTARSLRTLNSIWKGLDALDTHFESINFTKTNKLGNLVNSPTDFTASIVKLEMMYDALNKFEKRVEEELKNPDTGIRGTAVKGENEDKKRKWSESDIAQGSVKSSEGEGPNSNGRDMTGFMHIVQKEMSAADIFQDKEDDDEDEDDL
jgi:hypothetical protein